MKVIISGANGKMGSLLTTYLQAQKDVEIVDLIDNWQDYSPKASDVVIDFSHPSQLKFILDYAVKNKVKLVLGTTGYTKNDLEHIKTASEKIGIVQSYNFSLGIQLLINAIKESVPHIEGYDIEITETHHNQKQDAPSGTALMLFNAVNEVSETPFEHVSHHEGLRAKNSIGIHALRGGNVFGEHTIRFIGASESFEFTHTAFNKTLFVEGAYQAAQFIQHQKTGLYDLSAVVGGRT